MSETALKILGNDEDDNDDDDKESLMAPPTTTPPAENDLLARNKGDGLQSSLLSSP